MNRGAAVATGDVLLFLHADTHPAGGRRPRRSPPRLRARTPAPSASASTGRGRLLERLVNLRSRLFKVVYGDQALFVTRAAFERAGGFRPIPIMEDRDLAARLRRAGGLTVVPLAVTTSSRRHRRDGHVRTIARHWLIQLLYTLRVPPERLARIYPPVR